MSSVCLSRVCYSTKEIEREARDRERTEKEREREGERERERERKRKKERERIQQMRLLVYKLEQSKGPIDWSTFYIRCDFIVTYCTIVTYRTINHNVI